MPRRYDPAGSLYFPSEIDALLVTPIGKGHPMRAMPSAFRKARELRAGREPQPGGAAGNDRHRIMAEKTERSNRRMREIFTRMSTFCTGCSFSVRAY